MTRVLIVDDKEENLYYLTTLLEGNGCAVEAARHGAEALVKARRSSPEIIISDLLMPVMDGYTLLRHWKADPRLQKVPFIVYTATYTDPADEQLAMDLGADAFILKPCEPEDFMSRLRGVQARAATPAPSPQPKSKNEEEGLYREYSETLIRKLEEKTVQLEEANRQLQLDMAAREQAEAALRRTEEQLRQSQKMDAVGRLAGGVAHDFNNLLSVILSYSSLLLRQLKPADPMRMELEEIQQAGERATELTRQLLAFSRQQVLQPKVVDLNQVVLGMKSMLQRLLGADVELTLLTADSSLKVHADPSQLEQIIMNLVVNARDAMPRGGKLTIETSSVELDRGFASTHPGVVPGPYIRLALSDTGCGMDARTQERLFEPFFTTKEKGKGTGLGLSTVFGIVKQSRGHIWVQSEAGVGTTFQVYLPRTDRETEALGTAASLPAPTTLRGTETILLVEDDDQVRAMSRTMLTRYGYTVLDAPNGGEAFLICEKHPSNINLLVTDVVLPRMSGRELAERLAPMMPQMKVLFVSGYTEDVMDRQGVHEANMALLEKPITPEALLSKVRSVLDGRPTRG